MPKEVKYNGEMFAISKVTCRNKHYGLQCLTQMMAQDNITIRMQATPA